MPEGEEIQEMLGSVCAAQRQMFASPGMWLMSINLYCTMMVWLPSELL